MPVRRPPSCSSVRRFQSDWPTSWRRSTCSLTSSLGRRPCSSYTPGKFLRLSGEHRCLCSLILKRNEINCRPATLWAWLCPGPDCHRLSINHPLWRLLRLYFNLKINMCCSLCPCDLHEMKFCQRFVWSGFFRVITHYVITYVRWSGKPCGMSLWFNFGKRRQKWYKMRFQ